MPLNNTKLKSLIDFFFNKNLPDEKKVEFNNELAGINYFRNKNLSILLLFVFIVLLVTDYQNYSKGLWTQVPGYILLFYTHLLMTLGMTGVLVYSAVLRLDSDSAQPKHRQLFVLFCAYFNVVGSALVSTADQYIHGEIIVFVLCAFTYAIVSYQRPMVNLLMYSGAYVVLLIGVSYAQTNRDILQGHYINGTVLVILAFFLSGVLYSSRVKDFISRKTIEQQKAELQQANDELSQANQELQESLKALDESQGMIFTLTLALESRDRNTHGHSERVVDYALALADYLDLSEKERITLYRASVLHDIGKIGIPDAILYKPFSLTEEEWKIMRSHPFRGEAICSKLKFAQEILPIIRHHHERMDGKGYPDGLSGDSIPLLARIVSIADTVDAITSPRSYRSARSMESAIEELKRCSGTQFDPIFVDAFIKIYQKNAIM